MTKPTRRVRAGTPLPVDVVAPDPEPAFITCTECKADTIAAVVSAGIIFFVLGLVVGAFIWRYV